MKKYQYVIPVILLCFTTWTLAVEPSTLLGLESGELLKCNFKNMSDCSRLTKQDFALSSLAVSGEFLYLGLRSGDLRRCLLAKPDKCTTYHNFFYQINDLTISGKFIYVAYADGIIKCGLRKSDECTPFYVSEVPVRSLVISTRRLYVGTDDAILLCSLGDTQECIATGNRTSAVSALKVSDHSMYVGLQEGLIQRCELEDIDECTTLYETPSEIIALDIFDDNVLVSLGTGDIIRYFNDTNETITNIENAAMSVVTIYDTKNLEDTYKGESIDCTWQKVACPPYIIYYDIESREQFELYVKDGKLYSIKDRPYHIWRNSIFVMDPMGRIYASSKYPEYLLYHSSIMAGAPVAAAGEFSVKDGKITIATSCSEHYKPSLALNKQILSSLKRQGYDDTVEIEECEGTNLSVRDYNQTAWYYKAKLNRYLNKLKIFNLKH